MSSSRDKLRKKTQEQKQETPTTRKNDAFDAFIEREAQKNIVIDPLLQSLIPPLQEEELLNLEASIREEGVREDLVIWRDPAQAEGGNDYLLIDGHNRYQIIEKILGEGGAVKYGMRIMDFPDKEAVKDWMIVNQLGRRNLTNEQRSYLRGLRYEREKAKHGGEREAGASSQNGDLLKTHERLGAEFSVGKNTILRDADFARGLEKVGRQNPTLKQEILMGRHKVSKGDLQLLGRERNDDIPLDTPAALIIALAQLKPKKLRPPKSDPKFDIFKNQLQKIVRELHLESDPKAIEKIKALADELGKLLS